MGTVVNLTDLVKSKGSFIFIHEPAIRGGIFGLNTLVKAFIFK